MMVRAGGRCRLLSNNLFWQNRAFHIEVGDLGTTSRTSSGGHPGASLNQTATGFCALDGPTTARRQWLVQ
jgi:hypothetical protein